jgi:hypothetical protein
MVSHDPSQELMAESFGHAATLALIAPVPLDATKVWAVAVEGGLQSWGMCGKNSI